MRLIVSLTLIMLIHWVHLLYNIYKGNSSIIKVLTDNKLLNVKQIRRCLYNKHLQNIIFYIHDELRLCVTLMRKYLEDKSLNSLTEF